MPTGQPTHKLSSCAGLVPETRYCPASHRTTDFGEHCDAVLGPWLKVPAVHGRQVYVVLGAVECCTRLPDGHVLAAAESSRQTVSSMIVLSAAPNTVVLKNRWVDFAHVDLFFTQIGDVAMLADLK